ncbi:MAG TPA: hypothetical protein VMS18_10785 [Candidatus Binatia bacterium]|nr:hypothetical protein [Candidatus Binatia bacterium]
MSLVTILSSLLLCGSLIAQNAAPAAQSSSATPAAALTPSQTPTQAQTPAQTAKPAGATQHSRYHPDRFAGRAGTYYRMVWGVDSLIVKWTEAGEVIRFSYEVLDPEKAKMLNDKKNEPFLIDPQAGVKLVIPSLEKVGKLRQSGAPEAGKSYWMAFSNKGRLVKRGDHVTVVIGKFHADGLVVD